MSNTHPASSPSSFESASFEFKSSEKSSECSLNKTYSRGLSGERSANHETVSESFQKPSMIISSRDSEKKQLELLNDRLAGFMDKVRKLERQNKNLTKIARLQISGSGRSSPGGEIYEGELVRLRREIAQLTHDKAGLQVKLQNSERDLKDANDSNEKLEQERQDVEQKVKVLRKEVDDATIAKMDADKKVETLQDELKFLLCTTEKDDEASTQIASVMREETYESPAMINHLAESWKNIRTTYEQLTARNTSDMERIYRTNISDLQEQVKAADQAASEAKTEVLEGRRQLQSLTKDLERQRSANASLESQLSDMANEMDKESKEAIEKISELKEKLQNARDDMLNHLSDYKQLVDSKHSLDLEIATYRNLLEGGEDKIIKITKEVENIDFNGPTIEEEEIGGVHVDGTRRLSVMTEQSIVEVSTTSVVQKVVVNAMETSVDSVAVVQEELVTELADLEPQDTSPSSESVTEVVNMEPQDKPSSSESSEDEKMKEVEIPQKKKKGLFKGFFQGK